MKTRGELKWNVERALNQFYQDLEMAEVKDEIEDVYENFSSRIINICNEYFNFERESARVMPKKEEAFSFASLFETKINNWICGVLLSVCGLIAVIQILRYIGILNLNF